MKKNILSLLIILLSLNSQAQSSFNFPQSSNQQLIEEAVKEGLFIIRQDYKLQDVAAPTPTYYGRNNNPYFGATYSIGIKTTNGFYSDDKILHPWNYDSHYEQYRNNVTYVPVISETKYRPLETTTYTITPFSLDSCTVIYNNQLIYTQSNILGKEGFQINNMNGDKKGWLLWITSEKPIVTTADTIPVSLTTYRTELTFEEGKYLYEVKDPAINKTLLGGIYIIPEVTGIGTITFKLSGMTSKINGKWHVIRIENALNNGNLTPVKLTDTKNDSKKKKKNK